jgi:hypothetical protein
MTDQLRIPVSFRHPASDHHNECRLSASSVMEATGAPLMKMSHLEISLGGPDLSYRSLFER